MTWREYRFGDFAEVQPRVPLEKGTLYSFIEMSDVEPFRKNVVPGTTRRWNGSGGAKFQDGDTIFARITLCLEHGKTAKVAALLEGRGFGSTEFFVFRARKGISDPDFIFYVARSPIIRGPAIKSMIGASGRQRAQTIVIENKPVRVPALNEQRRIARLLCIYDDLIENNRRRIQLLEQAARLLYKEWFVHLRFPGHEHVKITAGVPQGWERKPLGEVAPLRYGKGLKEDDRVPGPHPVYGSSGIVGWHDKPLVRGPTIIVGRKGNVGSIYWSNCDCFPIDTVYYINSEHCSLYFYYALGQIPFMSTDVAVPGLNRDFAHSRTILVPDSKILILFHQHVEVMHTQLDRLARCNKALASARDLLLPRLMNGEIAV